MPLHYVNFYYFVRPSAYERPTIEMGYTYYRTNPNLLQAREVSKPLPTLRSGGDPKHN